MKHIIELDLPEDQEELNLLMRAQENYNILFDLANNIHNLNLIVGNNEEEEEMIDRVLSQVKNYILAEGFKEF